MQLIYQDPFSSVDPRFRIRDIVAEPWTIHGLFPGVERRRRADELLERVGIDPSLGDRRPASFSGGQLQRIGIARALALEPSLIVCDEPVSALDVSVQGQILNLLMDLQRERGIAYLFIAHDLAVVRHISERVSVMYAGRIVESGTRDQLFGHAGHPYTRALLVAMGVGADAVPRGGADDEAVRARALEADADLMAPEDTPTGCSFRARCPLAQPRCETERPLLVDRGAGHPVACHFPVSPGQTGTGASSP
jgi:peptide/nickel transport system ATP-binding protein/oligopeptide transport system ATP-binding protein